MAANHQRAPREFGKRYVVQWDGAAGRFDVMLGSQRIGSHTSQEGAAALAAAHSRRATLAGAGRSWLVAADAES